MNKGWIGVDLDGTLAFYDTWKGIEHIGEPIPTMVLSIKRGLELGHQFKIFTARVCNGEKAIKIIQDWLEEKAGLPRLDCTNIKDFNMIELWDDRAIRIIKNTGKRCCDN